MAADAWVVHDKAKEYAGDGTVDFDTDEFRINLYLSTSNIATTSIDALSAATNQVATNFGYTQDTKALASVTWTESAGTVTFDCADVVWTASGGSITARLAGIYDHDVASPVVKPIICHSLLDNTPADVTATDTNTLTIAINANGVFQVS